MRKHTLQKKLIWCPDNRKVIIYQYLLKIIRSSRVPAGLEPTLRQKSETLVVEIPIVPSLPFWKPCSKPVVVKHDFKRAVSLALMASNKPVITCLTESSAVCASAKMEAEKNNIAKRDNFIFIIKILFKIKILKCSTGW
jgi:hypothetical protein